MNPNPGRKRTTGEFVSGTQSFPPILADGSGWQRKPGPRTTGEFVSPVKSVPPPVPAMELILTLTSSDVDLVEMGTAVGGLITAVSAYERGLGGAGVKLTGIRTKPGEVILTLTPNEPNGAGDRVKQIESVFKNHLPPQVRTELDRLKPRVGGATMVVLAV
jgi:hypothetical protein